MPGSPAKAAAEGAGISNEQPIRVFLFGRMFASTENPMISAQGPRPLRTLAHKMIAAGFDFDQPHCIEAACSLVARGQDVGRRGSVSLAREHRAHG
jgi:hypothetical protein